MSSHHDNDLQVRRIIHFEDNDLDSPDNWSKVCDHHLYLYEERESYMHTVEEDLCVVRCDHEWYVQSGPHISSDKLIYI